MKFNDPAWRARRRERGESTDEVLVPSVHAPVARGTPPAPSRGVGQAPERGSAAQEAPGSQGRAGKRTWIEPSMAAALQAIHGASDVDELARKLLGAVMEAWRPSVAVVVVERDEQWKMTVGHGAAEGAAKARIPGDGPLAERMREGGVVHVADFRGEVIRSFGAAVLVPCAADGRCPMAVLTVAGETELGWIKALGPHVALAHRRLRRSSSASTPPPAPPRPIEIVREVVVEVPSGPDVAIALPFLRPLSETEVLRELLEVARRVSGSAKASALLFDATTQELVVRGVSGLGDERMEARILRGEARVPRLRPGQGAAGKCFATGIAQDVREAEGRVVSVPIVADGDRLGVLQLSEPSAVEFVPDDGGSMGLLAQVAGLAIARGRVLDKAGRDPESGLPRSQVVEALAERALRDGATPATALWVALGGGDGKGPSPQRIAKVASMLRRALAEHAELATHVGAGMFAAVLVGVDGPSSMRLASRICGEFGTMHYGESTWVFCAVEREAAERPGPLLARGRTAILEAVAAGPGIRFVLNGQEVEL